MASHSSILAWKIPRTEEPGRLQPMASKELDTTEQLNHQQIQLVLLVVMAQFLDLLEEDLATSLALELHQFLTLLTGDQ